MHSLPLKNNVYKERGAHAQAQAHTNKLEM
jgi:hypothetical protein